MLNCSCIVLFYRIQCVSLSAINSRPQQTSKHTPFQGIGTTLMYYLETKKQLVTMLVYTKYGCDHNNIPMHVGPKIFSPNSKMFNQYAISGNSANVYLKPHEEHPLRAVLITVDVNAIQIETPQLLQRPLSIIGGNSYLRVVYKAQELWNVKYSTIQAVPVSTWLLFD